MFSALISMTPLWPMTQDRAECGWATVDGISIVRGRKRHASHPILLQSARERAQWGYEIPGCIDPGPGCNVRTQRSSRLPCDGTTLSFYPPVRYSRCNHDDRTSRL